MTISYLILPVIYLIIGAAVVKYMNRAGFNIFDKLEELGVSYKVQGVIGFILAATWPVWVIIMAHARIDEIFNESEEVEDND